jgi:hypothetical protein
MHRTRALSAAAAAAAAAAVVTVAYLDELQFSSVQWL